MTTPVTKPDEESSKFAIQKACSPTSGVSPQQKPTPPTHHHPPISVVPFVSPERSALPPTVPSSSASSFSSRLRQIRESRALRAAQRKSPSPAALSPTHSTSSLPQHLGPLPEPEEAGPSHVSLDAFVSQHVLGVSPVTSQVSLDSSVREDLPTQDTHDGLPMPSQLKNGLTYFQDATAGYTSSSRRNESSGFEHQQEADTDGSDSSAPPSPPPSPPPAPLSLLPDSSPMLTTKHTLTTPVQNEGPDSVMQDWKDEKTHPGNVPTDLHRSSESLSSLSETPPPELPTSPPPPIPAPYTVEHDGALHKSPPTTLDAILPLADSLQLQLHPVEANSTTTEAESSTPNYSSATSTPSHSREVRLRPPKQQKAAQYQPERRSALEAMLISEPDIDERGKKRLSVAERRALTLQASRRPDGDSDPVLKRWSDASNLVPTGGGHGEDRPKSAQAMLRTSRNVHRSLKEDDLQPNGENRNRYSMPLRPELHQLDAHDINPVEHSPDSKVGRVAHKSWMKQRNVSEDSPVLSGSDLPSATQSRSQDSLNSMSYTSSQDIENSEEGEGEVRKGFSGSVVVSPLLAVSHSADDSTARRSEGQEEDKETESEKRSSFPYAALSSIHDNQTKAITTDEEEEKEGEERECTGSKDTSDVLPPPKADNAIGRKRKGLRSVGSLITVSFP